MKVKEVTCVAARRMSTGCGKKWNGLGGVHLATLKSKNADQAIGAHGQEMYYCPRTIVHENAALHREKTACVKPLLKCPFSYCSMFYRCLFYLRQRALCLGRKRERERRLGKETIQSTELLQVSSCEGWWEKRQQSCRTPNGSLTTRGGSG